MLSFLIGYSLLVGDVRFTCADGKPLSEVYVSAHRGISKTVDYIRKLAIKSCDGTLSVTDRGYLQNETDALLMDLSLTIDQTHFKDIFGSHYKPLLDGMKFELAYQSTTLEEYQVTHFNFPKISLDLMGRLSKSQNDIADFRENDNEGPSLLVINSVAIENPTRIDDSVSYSKYWASSIAWARKINEVRHATNTKAVVGDTLLLLNVDLDKFPVDMSPMKINAVSLSHSVAKNINELIAIINDYSNATGVKARFQAGAVNRIEVYGEDGRNITIDLNGKSQLSDLFMGAIPVQGEFVKTGVISLVSSRPIQLEDESHILGGSRTIPITGTGLSSIDITSVGSASDALETIDAARDQLAGLAPKIDRLVWACPK